jgi:predicted outer membrane repeat protein
MLFTASSNTNLDLTITDCIYDGNQIGESSGGALAILTSSGSTLQMDMDGCTFSQNYALNSGGAMLMRCIQSTGNAVIKNTLFTGNNAGSFGGAVYDRSSFDGVVSSQYFNCTFVNNSTDGNAGAIYLRGSQDGTQNATIGNCLFSGNTAADTAGAIYASALNSSPGINTSTIVNNTFYENQASVGDQIGGNIADITVANSILWGGADAIALSGGNPNFANCIIEGGYSGPGTSTNILNLDPLFVDPGNDDFSLSPCSPAIDNGDNSFIPQDLADIDNDNNTGERAARIRSLRPGSTARTHWLRRTVCAGCPRVPASRESPSRRCC